MINWTEYMTLCGNLVDQIAKDRPYKDKRITDIVAIARGGLMPAQYIAYALGVACIHSYGLITYDGVKKTSKLVYQKVDYKFTSNHHILIVDDIADTGKSLQHCIKDNCCFLGAGSVSTCTLHYKPNSSCVVPTYYAAIAKDDEWILYPYDDIL